MEEVIVKIKNGLPLNQAEEGIVLVMCLAYQRFLIREASKLSIILSKFDDESIRMANEEGGNLNITQQGIVSTCALLNALNV
jgi:hypothetical protein